MTKLTKDIAEKFAGLALAHVSREYPNIMQHVMGSAADVVGPRQAHPIFFGSYDWHSCVHGYWLLARLMRRYPELKQATEIKSLFAERITASNVEGECVYLRRPEARGFERPYGWGWLLALQAELEQHASEAGMQAARTLRPLADAFADRFRAYLPLSDYPIRTGVHSSTAFALRLAADYAEPADPELFALMRDKVFAWFGADQLAQAWEPSQDDFLSPTLMEAECMRRFTAPAAFRTWFENFLPRATEQQPASLFTPARVSDRTDGKIAHLDGLNFSRAWCWRSIASALGKDHPATRRANEAAARHINASLPHVAGDYMGEHWLATFALLALEA
ncbi:DUF2891 domain-containing protein [Candidatus Viadribacter manganicus]|uniref:DUF2891 domain-containing protein n=1 Tax=Candidatus Viadribacter manganicus TaxID=1759059 RepID=A0A1B1AJ50_9PROT|nr:DUF2891 domain-containing protein [Candidatus Viadribacter manganicus]ANP46550.1 hypothetical protein ATE48_11790 [Candidatus Viadribacter manganicus]